MDCIRKVMDLSNGHVTKEEMDRMDGSHPAIRIAPHEYGAVVFLPEVIEEDEMSKWSDLPNLLACVRFALKHGCFMISFDRDAEAIPDLPKFDW